jgi:hypothetical protein
VPFPDSPFNRARDPLKVFEYLAGYRPVVTCHTPQLAGMPYVTVTETRDEFVAQVEHALTVEVDRAAIDRYLADCTWAQRLDRLLGWLAEPVPPPAAAAPDVTGWYRAAAEGPGMNEYLARTEQLLDERTRFIQALETDARAKQSYIQNLEHSHPFLRLKKLFYR